jgi:hypothetical protein
MREIKRCVHSNVQSFVIIAISIFLTAQTFAQSSRDLYESESTYGVETIESDPIQFYLAPSIGSAFLVGNHLVDSNSRPSLSVRGGVLLTEQILATIGFERRSTDLLNPRTQNPINFANALGSNGSALFNYEQTSLDVGVELFILGREKRFRPFIGGSMGYRSGNLNYSQAALAALGNASFFDANYSIKQVFGSAHLGAEFAITKAIVITTQFAFEGVFGATGSDNESGASKFDPTKAEVANSLSKSLAYSLTVGMGLYF